MRRPARSSGRSAVSTRPSRFLAADRFQWQHDAQLVSPTTLTVFDDALLRHHGRRRLPEGQRDPHAGWCCQLDPGEPTRSSSSQAVLTRRQRRVTLHGQRSDVGRTETPLSAGATCRSSPSSASQASCMFDAVMPTPDISYRAYVQRWVGLPLYPPSGAAAHAQRGDHRLRQLERRDEAERLEGRGTLASGSRAVWSHKKQQDRIRDRRSRSRAPVAFQGRSTRRNAGRVIGTSKAFAAKS